MSGHDNDSASKKKSGAVMGLDPRVAMYGVLTLIFHAWATAAGRNVVGIPVVLARGLVLVLPTSPRMKRVGIAAFLLYHSWKTALRSPSIWDSDSWTLQADLVMAAWLLFGSDNADVVCRAIQDMFAWYYFAAGFWKLNSHFWDPNASCATVFFVQMVAQYISPFVSLDTATTIAGGAKAIAPAATLFIELLQGSLMVLGLKNRTCARAGVMFAIIFHLAVCFTPRPNDISGFALSCSARLIACASAEGTLATTRKVVEWSPYLAVFAGAISAFGWTWWETPNNWAFALYVASGGFVFIAVGSESTQEARTPVRRTRWSWLASGIAFAYAFLGLMTGLQEEGTPNMFANLKVHGGSNHFLLPTGLLFHAFADAPDSHPFGGGVVRIEKTTSNWLQTVYPADLTPILMPSNAVQLLERVGNPSPSFFNPGASRILGITPPPVRFFRYTVPALELKRLLREAKSHDGDFDLTYAQLPGTRGDEYWRASAVKRLFTVEVRDGQVTKCDIFDGISNKTAPCGPTDLPMLSDDAVPSILKRISMHHAYPIVTDDMDKLPPSIVCFGP
jgi:uncharacterized membrane protein YphA (DoxX/SURF4 family)